MYFSPVILQYYQLIASRRIQYDRDESKWNLKIIYSCPVKFSRILAYFKFS